MMIIMHPGRKPAAGQGRHRLHRRPRAHPHVIEGVERTVIGAVGDSRSVSPDRFFDPARGR